MAVPVRAELQAQLATWNGRIIGAANRQQALCGERLAALARHLPRREALYAPQRQRLDDAGDRLDRGQRHRLTVIAERLATRGRSEEHTSELQSIMTISSAGFSLTKKKKRDTNHTIT